MHHKFNVDHAEGLIAPDRYHELKPDVLLQRLAVPPGHTLLDLGCGNGFFTFPAAAAMGDSGMVIAADSSPQMLDALQRRNPPDTVQVLLSEEVALDIEDASVDAVVAISLYHELVNPLHNLTELKRIMKPDGRLMLVDWDPESKVEHGPRSSHRVLRGQAVSDLESAGFDILTEEIYTDQYWLIIASQSI